MSQRTALSVLFPAVVALLLLGAAAPLPVTAAINVAPLRVEFPAGQQARDLQLRNDGKTLLGVQIRVFAWNQGLGGDSYQLSRDFVVSPSIVEIEPGQTQTLHLIATVPALAAHEAAYRVVIDQLPGGVTAVQGAAQTRLRITLPLFAGGQGTPQGRAAPLIAKDRLLIGNPGGRAIKLQNVTLVQGGANHGFDGVNVPSYILGGAHLSFPLPTGISCTGGPVRMTYEIDRIRYDAAVPQNCT